MKIVFTNTIFFIQKAGGISRYFSNLARELNSLKKNFKIIAPLSKNIYLKDITKNQISLYVPRFPISFFFKKINNIIFNYFCRKHNPKIIHETYFNNFENLKSYKNTI